MQTLGTNLTYSGTRTELPRVPLPARAGERPEPQPGNLNPLLAPRGIGEGKQSEVVPITEDRV